MAPLSCGQEINADTTLDADLTCTGGPALIIVADDVVLDLGGHTVSGDPNSGSDTPGILLRNVTGATVRNGTVQHFAAGVVISGGGRNTVHAITAQDNIGPDGGNYGDGIVVSDSVDNRIEGNTARRNGPYSGITLLGKSHFNVVRHNVATDNNMLQTGDPTAGRQDSGIRIEGPGANHNRVESNTATGSGWNGISLLPVCQDPGSTPPCVGVPPNEHNRITNNITNGNGTSGSGDGIKVLEIGYALPAVHTTIADNCANNNTEYGICLDGYSTDNKAIRNSAYGNAQYDGFDGNTDPGCAADTWHSNDFGTVNQACVGAGSEPSPPWDPTSSMVDRATVTGLLRKNNRRLQRT